MDVAETVSASKQYGAAEAQELLAAVDEVVATKGQKVLRFAPSDDEVMGTILGRTGNLRAPALRVGKRLFVGFPKGGFEELQG